MLEYQPNYPLEANVDNTAIFHLPVADLQQDQSHEAVPTHKNFSNPKKNRNQELAKSLQALPRRNGTLPNLITMQPTDPLLEADGEFSNINDSQALEDSQ